MNKQLNTNESHDNQRKHMNIRENNWESMEPIGHQEKHLKLVRTNGNT